MTKKAKRKTAEEMELELGLATRSVTMEELMERWNSKSGRPRLSLGGGGRGPFRRCSLKKRPRGRYNLTMKAWRGDEDRVLRKVDVFDEDGDFIYALNLMASQIEACAWQHDLLGPDEKLERPTAKRKSGKRIVG